jgi:hypothetical protein
LNFSLFAFTANVERARAVIDAGADAIFVDWETRGKKDRQSGADTQINSDTPADLRRLRRAIDAPILCRINGPGPTLANEVATAIGCGADEIFLPMARTEADVLRFLDAVNGRCRASILIETQEAAAIAARLSDLPLERIYVGLNDLAISRGTPNIFAALADGSVDAIRQQIGVPFGIGGLTRPDAGHPIPCLLLLGEIIRLRASFTFLRRSFWADVAGRDLGVEVRRIRDAIAAAALRSEAEVEADRGAFQNAVAPLLSRAV